MCEKRSKLIEQNMNLVRHIAGKFFNTGLCMEDLVSVGMIGLVKGVDSFDPERKIKLVTYAAQCIKNEILMYLRRERSRRCEIPMEDPLLMDWEGNSLSPSNTEGVPEDSVSCGVEAEEEKQKLREAVFSLSLKEQVIVRLRYGIGMLEQKKRTQREVAEMLGFSQSYVSRLERSSIRKLRSEILGA